MKVEDFKAKFKVGDCIMGWATGKVVKITAIGEKRFLFADGSEKERVSAMDCWNRKWQLAPMAQIEAWVQTHGEFTARLK